MFWNLLNRLGSIERSARAQLSAGAGPLVRPGRGAGGNHRALLPEAEAAAREGAEHLAVAEEPRRPARQQPFSAAEAELAALSSASGGAAWPSWPWPVCAAGASSGHGLRYVLMIDNSASMSATDIAPSRLEDAKTRARKVVDSMSGDDLAMVISFAETARVVSNYTSDKRALLQRIDAIPASQSTTSLREALEVAAGLANPSKQIGEGIVATSAPATPKLFVYTDGGFPDVEGFSLGNLDPEVGGDWPASPPLHSPFHRRSVGRRRGQGQGSKSVRQRRDRRSSGADQRRATRRLPALRPRSQLPW